MESITWKYDGIHWIFYSSFVSSPPWVVLHGHVTVSMSIPRIDLYSPFLGYLWSFLLKFLPFAFLLDASILLKS